ncbi:Prophage LambdaSa04, DNA primase, P4 family, partial [human gut metagenome]
FNGKYWKEDKQLAIGTILEFMDLQLEEASEQYESAIKQLVQTGIPESIVREGGKGLVKLIDSPNQQPLPAKYLSAK